MSAHKKTKKDNRRRFSSKPRRHKKESHSRFASATVTPFEILLMWLDTKYGISELEFLFGSNDFGSLARILVARRFVDQVCSENSLLTNSDLEETFANTAIDAYLKALGLGRAE